MNRAVIALLGIASIAVPLFAHHGRGATYDDKKIITTNAVITEVAWRNPHVAIYMDIKDENFSSLTNLLWKRACKRN